MWKEDWRQGFLPASLLSPLRGDWSTLSLPEMRMPSAGMRSPACKSTRSPRTSSPTGNSKIPLERLTRQRMLSASSCSLRKADSLPYSERVEIKVARKTAMAMPAVSNQLKFRNMKTMLMASTMSRIFMTGSPKLAANWRRNPLRFWRVMRFSPYSLRERATSSGVSPRAVISIFGIVGVCISMVGSFAEDF